MGNLCGSKQSTESSRTIYPTTNILNDPGQTNAKFAGNRIKTTKYTVLTFLPKNLFEQFHRFANIYFVLIVILNFMPYINAFAKEVAPIPVLVVLSLTAFIDAYEDFRRYLSDRRINSQLTLVYSPEVESYCQTEWAHIHPGDFVRLHTGEVIPADMIILNSSDISGICHIETANLDGESNLKQCEVAKGYDSASFTPSLFTEPVTVEAPNSEIYHFSGRFLFDGKPIILRKQNLILRGCVLRNTEFIEGMVIYAGRETKAMLNNTGPRFKRSKLERQVNKDVLWCVLILAIVCITGALGSGIWQQSFPGTDVLFLALSQDSIISSAAFQAFLNFWTYIITFQAIIPLPLYVTLEFVKLHQVWHLTRDLGMYDEEHDKSIEVRAFNIPEDLGQIEYVFCDKTGTLTENKMQFKQASVNGYTYHADDIDDIEVEQFDTAQPRPQQNGAKINSIRVLSDSVRSLSMGATQTAAASASTSSEDPDPDRSRARDFLLALAICNTTVISVNKNNPTPLAMPKARRKGRQSQALDDTSNQGTMVGRSSGFFNLFSRNRSSTKSVADETSFGKNTVSSAIKTTGINGRALGPVPESDFNQSRPRFELSSASVEELDSVELTPQNRTRTIADASHESSQSSLAELRSRTHQNSTVSLLDDQSSVGFESVRRTKCPLTNQTLLASYESESPDEVCLVKASCRLGCKLIQRGPNFVQVWFAEQGLFTMRVLHVLPFDSTRKRMSVIVRHPQTHQTVLFTKGADSAILPRLAPEHHHDSRLVSSTNEHLEAFSHDGLRTLVIAKRELSEEEYTSWSKRMMEAESSFEGDSEQLVADLTDEIEDKLSLLGATGIEDRLQDQVPETIKALREANMHVWVLTGDKQETAVNIAYSANLVSDDQCLLHLNAEDSLETAKLIDLFLREIKRYQRSGFTDLYPPLATCMQDGMAPIYSARDQSESNEDVELEGEEDSVSEITMSPVDSNGGYVNPVGVGTSAETRRRAASVRRQMSAKYWQVHQGITALPPRYVNTDGAGDVGSDPVKRPDIAATPADRHSHFALVLDGSTLTHALNKDNRDSFIKLCQRCRSVVCCRATPLQKADVVETVKKQLHVQTLAIGDGANDVNMIQRADVGVGISGQEGMQATMASDFAITRFKFLRRLLLVHGNWNYDKLARTALYLFYRDAIYIFVMFWFQLFNGFSASQAFDQLSQILFAVTITGVPPFVMGIWDKPLDAETLMVNPCLYQDGQKSATYRAWHFWLQIADAIWQSLVIFFVPYLMCVDTNMGIWQFGMIQMNILVLCSLIHMGIECKHWTPFHFLTLIGSYALPWLAFMMVYSAVGVTSLRPESPYWVMFRNLADARFWLSALVVVPVALLPRIMMNALANSLNPNLMSIAAILVKKYGKGARLPLEPYLKSGPSGDQATMDGPDGNTLRSPTAILQEAQTRAGDAAPSPFRLPRGMSLVDDGPFRIMPRVERLLDAGSRLIRGMPVVNSEQVAQTHANTAATLPIPVTTYFDRPNSAPSCKDSRRTFPTPFRQMRRGTLSRDHVLDRGEGDRSSRIHRRSLSTNTTNDIDDMEPRVQGSREQFGNSASTECPMLESCTPYRL